MKPLKPLFLKTYGKQTRKLPAWISPEDRKQAFDSSVSTDGSVFEPPKAMKKRERKTAVKSRRGVRPAKEKAMQCLTEKSLDEGTKSDEENMMIPAQRTRATREKKSSSSKTVTKRKCVTESSSDEENIETASASPAQTSPQSKKSRRAQRVSVAGTLMQQSDRKMPALKQQRKSVKRKAEFGVRPPSVGRFVTRRRRTLKPKPSQAVVSLLSSSDDFTSESQYSRKLHRPSRKMPPAFVMSSAENSLNAAGTSNFAANPLQELSLNELTDRSLKLRPRKPMFCSTPSAGSFSKPRSHNAFLLKDHSTTPPSLAVSCIGDLSPSQEDLVSATSSEKRQHDEPEVHHHRDTSADLFMDPLKRSTSEGSKMKSGLDLPSGCLLSTDSADNSQFVSAAGGLEWLIEALKRKCLTERCTVQMERIERNALSQLCSQTTFSSCVEQPSSVHIQHNDESAQCSQSLLHLELSASTLVTSDSLQAVDGLEDAALVTHLETLPAADREQSAAHSSAQESMEQSESELYGGSTRHHADGSLQQTATQDVTKFDKGKTNDSKDIGCSAQISERMTESLRRSKSSPQTMAQSPETESVKNMPKLTALIKDKCLTNYPTVEIPRLTWTDLKKGLQIKEDSSKSTAVSISAGDEQTNSDYLSVSDSNDNIPSKKVNMRSQRSATSEDDVTTKVTKHLCDVIPKRKKASVAPKEKKKRRSTSTDKPGTARKVCVSGMSVSRWKNKGSANKQMIGGRTALRGNAKAADCSINELISKQGKQPQEMLAAAASFSTPLRANRLNLSSLLADLTPNTPTWSRLKAALSVHRKVLLTPRSSATGTPVRTKFGDLSQDLFSVTLRTPVSRHHRSQLRSLHSVVVCEDEDLSDAEKVCAECGQQKPLPWEECILPSRMKRCVKIGEGTFGEVFSTTNASGETVALKIIPVEGAEKVNGEDQKTFGEILHEIIISKELSGLKEKQQNQTHGFIGLNDLHCVQGCYPPDFLNAWDTFDRRKGSENDRPDFFQKDQLFIILEFEFGGIDLENSNGTLPVLGAAKSILHQVTAALSVAEQELHFEHRDLHWGNVLVKTTKQRTGSFTLNGTTHTVETRGVLVRIIDYSLSRLEIDDLTVSCDISNDEELFMGKGDYQFDIYRLMRQENGNNWSSYHPHTNVLWLHYLCSKLLSMKYRSSGGRGAKDVRKELTRFHDNVLQYSSATEVLQNCPMFQ